MPTRLCGECGKRKSIRGVWYLVAPGAHGSPFVCESCFQGHGRAHALAA